MYNHKHIFVDVWLPALFLVALAVGCADDKGRITGPHDLTPPTVISTVPADGATRVSLTANITVTFSEAMDTSTINTTTITLTQGLTPVAGVVSYTGVVATFNPTTKLASSTVYRATITTSAKDSAGNAMVSNYDWTFTTDLIVDVTPPTVGSTVPADRVTGVSVSANISATFSEAMNAGTITTGTMTLHQGNTPIAGAVTYTGVTATFNPTAVLAPDAVYTATITTDARDLAGNAMVSNYVWTFRTVTPPTVVSTVPVDSATGVSVSANISATFSEAMDAGTITTGTMTLHQGNAQISGAVTYAGVVATFNPTAVLAPSTAYTATVTTGARDLDSNAILHNYVWTFTTGTPPTVVSTVPADNDSGVSVSANITATFSRAMDPSTITTGTMTLYQGDTLIHGVVSYAGGVATFNPAAVLAPDTVTIATITTGARDLAGNAMVSNYVWTFRTVTPPTVVSTVPVDMASGVSVGTNITATFSRAMDPLTITNVTMTLEYYYDHQIIYVPGAVTYAGRVATFQPTANLALSKVYTATVTTGARDLDGIAMICSYVWTFTTVE